LGFVTDGALADVGTATSVPSTAGAAAVEVDDLTIAFGSNFDFPGSAAGAGDTLDLRSIASSIFLGSTDACSFCFFSRSAACFCFHASSLASLSAFFSSSV
jgi:hypothetical protein